MSTSSVSQNQHFNAYYLDNTLLVQFVISEFIITSLLVEKLKSLTDECLQSKIKLDKASAQVYETLSVLVGIKQYRKPAAFSRWTKGPLTKLKDYCEQYYRNSGAKNELVESMHSHAYQAWIGALQNMEILNSFQISISKVTLANVKQSLGILFTSLNSFSKSIPQFIKDNIDNEYVIFFLLRKKEELVHIYGASFVNKLLKVGKVPELVQSFTERGFENILSLISTTIQK